MVLLQSRRRNTVTVTEAGQLRGRTQTQTPVRAGFSLHDYLNRRATKLAKSKIRLFPKPSINPKSEQGHPKSLDRTLDTR